MKQETVFNRLDKRSLSELNKAEVRGWVIDRLLEIEHRINEKIVNHFSPKDKTEFTQVMLNSSVLDMGSKIKVLSNIGTLDNKGLEKIRKMCSIRNGFAHAPILTAHKIVITEKGIDDVDVGATSKDIVSVMNARGKIEAKNAFDELVKFWELNNEVREMI
jgi:hypothetical protein